MRGRGSRRDVPAPARKKPGTHMGARLLVSGNP
ncbi:hypothetical protein BHE75_01958 [Sphingomonas haloaromaticamans]|uniref:Uncharacterized protein n=1 Tax=Edaphosphingomonas haloaromaticamans TaxID=653954 RepID=A0A1S1HCN6_9SPHN|nr:hypothetical protein BHE75_01958 [Sphingomonas haloaromaticamans]